MFVFQHVHTLYIATLWFNARLNKNTLYNGTHFELKNVRQKCNTYNSSHPIHYTPSLILVKKNNNNFQPYQHLNWEHTFFKQISQETRLALPV